MANKNRKKRCRRKKIKKEIRKDNYKHRREMKSKVNRTGLVPHRLNEISQEPIEK